MSISFYKNQLLVNSPMKLAYFDLDGNYKGELKVKTIDRILFPFDNKYIGLGSTVEDEEDETWKIDIVKF